MRLNLLMCKGRHDKGETLTVIWVIIILTKTITFGKVPVKSPTFYFFLFFFLHMFTYFTCLKRSSLPCIIWAPYKFITFWHSDLFFFSSITKLGRAMSKSTCTAFEEAGFLHAAWPMNTCRTHGVWKCCATSSARMPVARVTFDPSLFFYTAPCLKAYSLKNCCQSLTFIRQSGDTQVSLRVKGRSPFISWSKDTQ